MGPRLKLELIKIEDGVCEGEILYHKYGGTLYYYYWFKNITAINCQISLHYYYFAKYIFSRIKDRKSNFRTSKKKRKRKVSINALY